LRSANPGWKVLSAGDTVIIETASPDPDLPAKLALARNAIVRREGQQAVGTGPFSISQWLSGKHLTLAANDQYWAGRPFLDSVAIDFGENDREQMTALDLGKSDLAEIAAENILRTKSEGRTVVTSEPSELLSLVFALPPRSDDDMHARNALALSIDAVAINNVVLQSGGEPSRALLPNWLSGYAFVFQSAAIPENARPERAQAKQVASFNLGFDPADPIARTVAGRILLNARDVGVSLQLVTTGNPDLSLMRIPLPSSNPQTALRELARALELPEPKLTGNSLSDLYSAEISLLQSHRIIPLLHLRTGAALGANVRNFGVQPDGTWQLRNLWLATEKP
jgi:MarR-like DNA-binding transcriptional regulator SgrR of sgrS sRNA